MATKGQGGCKFFKPADRYPDVFIEFNETINDYDIAFVLVKIRELGRSFSQIRGAAAHSRDNPF